MEGIDPVCISQHSDSYRKICFWLDGLFSGDPSRLGQLPWRSSREETLGIKVLVQDYYRPDALPFIQSTVSKH